jgi:hypothetical protein
MSAFLFVAMFFAIGIAWTAVDRWEVEHSKRRKRAGHLEE